MACIEIQDLKNYILENDQIETILEELGCHHITRRNGCYTCGNPDGDNKSAITVYENEFLLAIDYTRELPKCGNSSDLFSLVQFFKKESFFQSIKQVCAWIGIDYYHDFDSDMPASIRIAQAIIELSGGDSKELDDKPIKPIDEKLLSYYMPYVNDLFYRDHINYVTQVKFEIGYDEQTNRITIPIRDELGTLVGVKGRLFSKNVDTDELKYLYIEPTNRSRVLYGLNHTYNDIQMEHFVYVGEAEKSVMQLWSMGIHNSVATGGKKVSQQQIDMLTRLCVEVVFLFDKDVSRDELDTLAERFMDGVAVYAVVDTENILNEKESPTDDPEKFKHLISKCKKRIK